MEQESTQATRGQAKFIDGRVSSNAMNKTVVISVAMKIKHPAYGKFVTRTKKYVAHDEKNECSVGDQVRIIATRPMSKTKRWRVQSIIERAV